MEDVIAVVFMKKKNPIFVCVHFGILYLFGCVCMCLYVIKCHLFDFWVGFCVVVCFWLFVVVWVFYVVFLLG